MKKILLILGILLALVLVLALVAPKEISLERAILIKAPKQTVYDYLRDFNNFGNWSPWQELDSNIVVNISGNAGEVGSKYIWKSETIGSGNQEIVALKTNEAIDIKLSMDNWGEASDAGFVLKDADSDTHLTWKLHSKMPIPFNIMTLFTDFSGLVGKDYEKGLNKLKPIIEAMVADINYKPSTTKIVETEYKGGTFALRRKTVPFKDISTFFQESYMLIMKEVASKKQTLAGNPQGFFYTYDPQKQQTDMAAAMPIAGNTALSNGITLAKIPPTKALCVDYYGDYAKTEPVYLAIEAYAKDKNYQISEPATEEYITDPVMEKDTAKWLTRICMPIK